MGKKDIYFQKAFSTDSLANKNNMKNLTSITLIFLFLLFGCVSHDKMQFQAGSGDVGRFILQQVITFGGQPITTSGLPTINSEWNYSQDQYGVVIRLSRDNYETIENLLKLAFGVPKFGPSETIDGGKLGGYSLTPQGGVIQFGYDNKCTQVIITKQLVMTTEN
jgi:hypothetical protein